MQMAAANNGNGGGLGELGGGISDPIPTDSVMGDVNSTIDLTSFPAAGVGPVTPPFFASSNPSPLFITQTAGGGGGAGVTNAIVGPLANLGNSLSRILGPSPSLVPGTGVIYNPQTGQLLQSQYGTAAGSVLTSLATGLLPLALIFGVIVLVGSMGGKK